MFLATKPQINIIDKQRLHVFRRPGFIAWLLLATSASIFYMVTRRLTDNILASLILLLAEITFSLDALGEWQDLVLDKEENKATVTLCSWCDKLCSKVPEKSLTVMRMSDIRHVGISTELGIFLLGFNGKILSFSTRGLSHEEAREFKKKINYYLNTSRIERLDRCTFDPYDRLITPSDSEDEILKDDYPRGKREPLSVVRNRVIESATPVRVPLQNNEHDIRRQSSSPTLGNDYSPRSRRRHVRNVINFGNTAVDDHARVVAPRYDYPRCMRHGCTIPLRMQNAGSAC
ncbi:uncharacterized protein LOC107267180 [Cephus cinctus]|uniref:Uncharacterized protein LOC107267180 n=1 Tax=Cephus cinctus TaxID=211228 RepID=A0AAJ7BU79_CEPCN|nr:uncharacterized protein LOC107267180 [Cephus cinctus]